MKKFTQLAVLALGLSAGSLAFAEAQCVAHPKAEQIPLEPFKKALEDKGFVIKSFKPDGNCYELYAKSPKGKKVEMYIDTKTGDVVKKIIE